MNWKSYGINPRFQQATLASIDPAYFLDVVDYSKNAAELLQQGRGLLLSGPPGIGKTWAMAALMKHLRETLYPFDFCMVTAPQFFETAYQADAVDGYRQQSWTKTYERVNALVINDLGKEDRSRSWTAESVIYKLGRTLRARHEAMLPIFITTNLSLQNVPSVEGTYGPSIWSLIYDLTSVRAEIVAPDIRRGGLHASTGNRQPEG